jgi:hypothetical protein
LIAVCTGFWLLRVWQLRGDQVQVFANYDVLAYWLPLLREAAAQWRSGHVPLWNPYQALGTPLLATQQVAALYPLNVLYLLLPAGTAWLLTGLLHHLVATIAMYVWCRRLSLPPLAAAVGGASYGFSAIFLGRYLYLPDELACLAWLPALFASLERLLEVPRPRQAACLAIVWSLHVLGGDADTIVRSAWLVAGYAAARLAIREQGERRSWHAPMALFAAAVCTAGLTAVQWLPTLELLRWSVRAPGALTSAQQAGFTAPLSEMLVNRVRGVATLSISSSLPLVLAVVGWWLWPRRRVAWFFAVAGVAVCLLSLGPATPLYEMWQYLPSGSWFRVPARWLNLLPLCVSVLAAAGTHCLFNAATAPARRGQHVLAAALLTVTTAKIVLLAQAHLLRLWLLAAILDVVPFYLLLHFEKRSRLADTVRPFRRAGVGLVLLVAATPALLYRPDGLSPHRVDGLYAPYAGLFAAIRAASPGRVLSLLPIADGRPWAKLGTYFEVPVLNDFEPLSLRDFDSFSRYVSGRQANSGDPRQALDVFTGEIPPPLGHYQPRLLELAGVRFVVAEQAAAAQVSTWLQGSSLWRERWRIAGAVVYENQAALPRAFVMAASAARVVAGESCAEQLLAPAFDLRSNLLVDTPAAAVHEAAAAINAKADVVEAAPQRVRVAVTTDKVGYVVLADAFYPGWTATVDGLKTPILRADCFVRAVAIDVGVHDVVFEYVPASFRGGVAITMFSLLAVLILAVREPAHAIGDEE